MRQALSNIFAYNEIESELARNKMISAAAFSRVSLDVMSFNDSFVGLHNDGVMLTYINAICFHQYTTIVFLDGYVDLLFTFGDFKNIEIEGLGKNRAGMTMIANLSRFSILGQGKTFERCLSMKFKTQILVECYGLKIDQMPEYIRLALLGRSGQPIQIHSSLSARGEAALHAIFACRMAPPLFQRYVHAKAEELICESIDNLNAAYSDNGDGLSLSPRQIEHQKIETAASIYRQNMAGAPTIDLMARRLKLNKNKLIAGFRDLYGCGPGEYNRLKTIEWACSRLDEGGHSISSIAKAAGYSSVSAFSRSFTRQTGLAPSVWARKDKA